MQVFETSSVPEAVRIASIAPIQAKIEEIGKFIEEWKGLQGKVEVLLQRWRAKLIVTYLK
jgi:hypothetical protein